MAGIVHARRDLVDEQGFPPAAARRALFDDEHFDRDHADIGERGGDAGGEVDRRSRRCRRERCRRAGHAQDMVLVDIFADVVGGEGTVHAARGDDRNFPHEWHESFEDCRPAAEAAEDDGEIGSLAHHRLAFSVIAETPGLQDRRPAELGDCTGERAGIVDLGKRRGANAEPVQKRFLAEPILGDGERLRIGKDRAAGGEESRGSVPARSRIHK